MKKGFKITRHKGFHMTFENGVTVSVQFGPGNYCDKREQDFDVPKQVDVVNSTNAEVAVWKEDKTWITKEFKDEGDDVLGWQSPEDVLKLLNWAKNYKVD